MSRFLKQFGLMAVIIVSGTIIDWVVHSSFERFYVEPGYYWGKIVFGIIWGLIVFWVFKRMVRVSSPKTFAIGVSAVVALFLQTKYFYQGRDNLFVFLFLFLHFLMFLPGSFWVFKKYPKILVGNSFVGRPTPARWAGFAGFVLLAEFVFFAYFTWIVGYARF